MPPKPVKRAIKDALANLPKDSFEEFCHAVRDRPGEPTVPYNKVEGKSFLVIADVLISTFTEAEAPSVTAELLEEIGCSAQATKLLEETRGQSSRNSGAAAVNFTARGGSAEADFVEKHRAALIDRVTSVAPILDDLLDNEIVTQAKYDEILGISTSRDQIRKLYSYLNSAGRTGKEVFYKSLLKHEKPLMNDLQRNQ